MNSSTAICSVQVFKDSFWLPVASVISYSLGCLVVGSWFVGIWKDMTNPQKFWTIFSILKAWNKILVSSDEIILDSIWYKFSSDQMGIWVFVIVGIQLFQVWIAPGDFDFCFLNNLALNSHICMMCLSLSLTTAFKFFVLAKRSIPEMNESLFSKIAIVLIVLISWIVSSIKFYSGDTKPTYNQVHIIECL